MGAKKKLGDLFHWAEKKGRKSEKYVFSPKQLNLSSDPHSMKQLEIECALFRDIFGPLKRFQISNVFVAFQISKLNLLPDCYKLIQMIHMHPEKQKSFSFHISLYVIFNRVNECHDFMTWAISKLRYHIICFTQQLISNIKQFSFSMITT